jgi:hypothetical protein
MILEKEWNDLQKSIHEIDLTIKQRCDTLVTVSFHTGKDFRKGILDDQEKKWIVFFRLVCYF